MSSERKIAYKGAVVVTAMSVLGTFARPEPQRRPVLHDATQPRSSARFDQELLQGLPTVLSGPTPTPTPELFFATTSITSQERQEEAIKRVWEEYAKKEDPTAPVAFRFKDIISSYDQLRLMAAHYWYFGELPEDLAGRVQRRNVETPLSFSDLKYLYGGFGFHSSNEDGFVVFYKLPSGSNVRGTLTCATPITPGIQLLGLTTNEGMYPQDYYVKYRNPVSIKVSLLNEGGKTLEITVPGGTYVQPVDYWSITDPNDKGEFPIGDVYEIPTQPFQCSLP